MPVIKTSLIKTRTWLEIREKYIQSESVFTAFTIQYFTIHIRQSSCENSDLLFVFYVCHSSGKTGIWNCSLINTISTSARGITNAVITANQMQEESFLNNDLNIPGLTVDDKKAKVKTIKNNMA